MGKQIMNNKIEHPIGGNAQANPKSSRFQRCLHPQIHQVDRYPGKEDGKQVVKLNHTMIGLVVRSVDLPKYPVEKKAVHQV